jgi:TRAP-type C4-dicarboxylate transport system permease small subunit
MQFPRRVFATILALVSPAIALAASPQLHNPLGTASVPEIIGRLINAMLGVVGSFALLMFILGGWHWLTARGEHEKITKGLETIKWAAIGLLVIFAAYPLANFVLTSLASSTN